MTQEQATAIAELREEGHIVTKMKNKPNILSTPGPWLRNGNFVYAYMEIPGNTYGIKNTVNRMTVQVSAHHSVENYDQEITANVCLIKHAPELIEFMWKLGDVLADGNTTIPQKLKAEHARLMKTVTGYC